MIVAWGKRIKYDVSRILKKGINPFIKIPSISFHIVQSSATKLHLRCDIIGRDGNIVEHTESLCPNASGSSC